MKDLFEKEQEVFDQAWEYLESIEKEPYCDRQRYAELAKEYGRILKLVRRVTRVSDKTAVELNADKIRLLSKVQYDGLTGIYNRRYFDEEFHRLVGECAAQQTPLGILMMDVDFFKRYNDTYGHGMGDDCLREIARALEESVTENSGFAARYGGEEFVMILHGADLQDVRAMGERILRNIRLLQIVHEKNEVRDVVTISIGGTSIVPSGEDEEKAYLECADIALYQSKQSGRDRFTLRMFKEEEK